MDPLAAVIIMGILAAAVIVQHAMQGHKLNAEFAKLRYLAQWAIEHCPPPVDSVHTGIIGVKPAMPGDVKFHIPSSLFGERLDFTAPNSSTLT